VNLLIKVVAPTVVLLTAATAVALAAPSTPITPYPTVPANADACKVEKLEIQKKQLEYDYTKKVYDRAKAAFDRGVGSAVALYQAELALNQALIALNNAKYAESACRNDKSNAADKICVGLALELNRLIDELALRQEVERLTKAIYDIAADAVRRGAGSPEDAELAEKNWKVAQLDRQQVEQKIADQRAKIAATPACKDYPFDRPTPTSITPPTTGTSTTIVPTEPTFTTQPTTEPIPTTATPYRHTPNSPSDAVVMPSLPAKQFFAEGPSVCRAGG
jgi:hypothetical protein